ncbi:MAG: hypothetical protein IPL46_19970 [Saprospiraceae bacterium]|nr:hypothetical protein [Saprospiraceae bacterium]
MQKGVDIIIQGRLEGELWSGFTDILRRVEVPSRWGSWSYEVLDAKLAMNTKAGSVLQLCVYTDLLTQIQGTEPENMYVVKPGPDQIGFEEECFRYQDFAAYYRRTRNDLLKQMEHEQLDNSYPHPVDNCTQCSWWLDCDKRRRADDHLTFIAGIHKSHISN